MIAEIELITTDQGTEARIQCGMCKTFYNIPVNRSQFDDWRNGRWAQDAFKDMNADWREMFISGTCPPCFDKLFEGFDKE